MVNFDFQTVTSAPDLIRVMMEIAEKEFSNGSERREWVLAQVRALMQTPQQVPESIITDLTVLMNQGLLDSFMDVMANTARGMYQINKRSNHVTQKFESIRFGSQARLMGV